MPCKECSELCQSSCITVHMAGASPCTVRFACLVLQASAVASSFGSPQDPLLQSSSPFLWPLWPHLWAWRSADGPSATDNTKAHGHRGLYDRTGNVKLPCCSHLALLGWDTAQSLKHDKNKLQCQHGTSQRLLPHHACACPLWACIANPSSPVSPSLGSACVHHAIVLALASRRVKGAPEKNTMGL